jgi:hypothetical protein
MDLNRIPKPVLVIGVILIGIALMPFFQPMADVCDVQYKNFSESQAGALFKKKWKVGKNSGVNEPSYEADFRACLASNTAGGCLRYFNLLKSVAEDLRAMPDTCGSYIADKGPVMRALRDGVILFAEIAWGEKPPEVGEVKKGWLDLGDIAIYCSLKDQWLRLLGKESWEELKTSVYRKLPGEGKVYQEIKEGEPITARVCLNCEYLKKANQVFENPQDIFVRSIFAIRCEMLR